MSDVSAASIIYRLDRWQEDLSRQNALVHRLARYLITLHGAEAEQAIYHGAAAVAPSPSPPSAPSPPVAPSSPAPAAPAAPVAPLYTRVDPRDAARRIIEKARYDDVEICLIDRRDLEALLAAAGI